jgi:hypothetical protein
MSFKNGHTSFVQAVAGRTASGGLTARDRNDMVAIGKKQQLKVCHQTICQNHM